MKTTSTLTARDAWPRAAATVAVGTGAASLETPTGGTCHIVWSSSILISNKR